MIPDISYAVEGAPYPGLRAFRRSETHLFFGREGCVNDMVGRLAKTRFLAVVGSSGTGKSSLVKAGLLNALELGLMAEAGSRWLIAEMRPEGTPLRNLAEALLKAKAPQCQHSAIEVELLRAFLSRGPRSVIEWCRAGHLPHGYNLLLLVDQFEELFRYQNYADRDDADAFTALLIESAHTDEFSIYVTITMRSEFLGACALMTDLVEEINNGTYLTPRITREQCRDAIVGPARVGGVEIEQPLVNRLLNDLASFAPWEKAGAGGNENTPLDRLVRRADQLPLLQYTLNRMWAQARARFPGRRVKLGLDDYKGLSHALNEQADQIFEQLERENLPVEQVFRALTSGTSLADAGRLPTPFDRLVAICGGDEAGVRKVVDAYRAPECHFLLPEIETYPRLSLDTMIDISHESLIRQWRRLSEWVAKEAVAAQQWRRLNDRANVGDVLQDRALDNMVAWREETKPNAAWAERYGGDYAAAMGFLDKSSREERNRRWIRNGTVAGVFAILLTAAGVTFHLWKSAKDNLVAMQLQQKRAERNFTTAKKVVQNLTFNLSASLDSKAKADIFVVHQYFWKAKATLDQLAKESPDDAELLGIQAIVLDKFTDGYRAANGYHEMALGVANQANGLLRRLVEREPNNASWQASLSLNLDKIGDLERRLHDPRSARAHFDQALAIDRDLMRRAPAREEHSRQAAIELINIGDLQLDARNEQAALESYREALELRSKLAASYAMLPSYQSDLAESLDRIGNVKNKMGDTQGALEAREQELKVYRKIIHPKFGWPSEDDYTNYSVALIEVARLQQQSGNDSGALASYQESLQTARNHLDPNHLDPEDWAPRFVSMSAAIGDLQLKLSNVEAAKKSYADAAADQLRWVEMRSSNLRDETAKTAYIDDCGTGSWYALLSNRAQQAAELAEAALKLDPSKRWIDVNRAHAYLLLGRYDDAKAIYLKHKDTPSDLNGRMTTDIIRGEFTQFRKLGLATDAIDRMAKDLGL
jgi:tetratricopeptide (TPR) repeat protein